MFSAVNHTDRTIVVSFKGTSNGTDIIHDAGSVALGLFPRAVTSAIASTFNIPHRFNSAMHFTREM